MVTFSTRVMGHFYETSFRYLRYGVCCIAFIFFFFPSFITAEEIKKNEKIVPIQYKVAEEAVKSDKTEKAEEVVKEEEEEKLDIFEYKITKKRTKGISLDTLNQYGSEGWELVSVFYEKGAKYMIFKRKVIEEQTDK